MAAGHRGAARRVAFILLLLQQSGARRTLAGSATLVGCAVLLSVVAVEAVLLEAVPVAAANADHATVATAFALSNGVFVRIYALARAPLVFAGIGFALSRTTIVPRVFARTAVLIAGLFLISGLAAVFGSAGLILATVMSAVEAIWIPPPPSPSPAVWPGSGRSSPALAGRRSRDAIPVSGRQCRTAGAVRVPAVLLAPGPRVHLGWAGSSSQ